MPDENIQELPEEGATQDIQELPLPGGMTSPLEEAQPGTGAQELQDRMDNLNDIEKNLVIEHLTPEIVQVLGLIGGPAMSDFFGEFVDPNKLLIPVDRNEFLNGQQGLPQQSTPSSLSIPEEEGDVELSTL